MFASLPGVRLFDRPDDRGGTYRELARASFVTTVNLSPFRGNAPADGRLVARAPTPPNSSTRLLPKEGAVIHHGHGPFAPPTPTPIGHRDQLGIALSRSWSLSFDDVRGDATVAERRMAATSIYRAEEDGGAGR